MSLFGVIQRALRIGLKVNNAPADSLLAVDSNSKLSTETNVKTKDGKMGIGIAGDPSSRLHVPLENDATTPTISIGDGNTGLYESSDNVLKMSIGGVATWTYTTSYMGSAGINKPQFLNETASATNPNIVPDGFDTDTGIGANTDNQLSLISGASEGIRITKVGTGNATLKHSINGKLGQNTGDEIAYLFAYETNKATSGDDTGVEIAFTDTDSPGTSLTFSIKVGGSPKLTVDNAGNLRAYGDLRSDTGFNINGSAGATGSFTAQSGETVTVTNGLITSIV